jgi:O-antigen ligase
MKNQTARHLTLIGILITLVFTPWFNKDSLVIPKQIVLVITAAFLLPRIVTYIKVICRSKLGKIVILIISLIVLQMILVMTISEAPFEQELFGRSGRLLGFLTYFSLLIVLVASITVFEIKNLHLISGSIFLTGILVSTYAIFQSFGIDFFKWELRTNTVITTLGNPNYTSAFAAIIALPAISYVNRKSKKLVYVILVFGMVLFTIYRSESIQGYIALLVSVSTYTLLYAWNKSKKYFISIVAILTPSFVLLIMGTLGHGIFSRFLYKVSVESRGDFWRSAVNGANANPVFGVGLDSFGDFYLKYRDKVAADHSFAEFTDSAHNYILDHAVQGGYPLAFLNLMIIIVVVVVFLQTQKEVQMLNDSYLVIFASWVAMQSTFLISPPSIPILFWNALFSGAIVGVAFRSKYPSQFDSMATKSHSMDFNGLISSIAVVGAVLLMLPLFNVDRQFAQSLKNGDGNLGLIVVEKFPRSVGRYTTVSRLLLESGQNKYALDVARSTLNFNKNTISAWGTIMVNPLATYDERILAKKELLRLDPFNKEVPTYEITPSR